MRAIVLEEFGDPEVLHPAEVPAPTAGPGELVIDVHAAGVNPVDTKIRDGRYRGRLPFELPIVPGWDAAGVVASVGPGVTRFGVGDRVWAYCRKPLVKWGAYAEQIAVAESAVAAMPARLDFAEAASVPLAALTAWQSLFDAARLARGQTLLVQAGAGGVGGFAVQLGRHAGARVLATASAANHAYVRDLGADEVIDYTGGPFEEAVRRLAPAGVDVGFDTVGEEIQGRTLSVVRAGGVLVSILALTVAEEAQRRGVRAEYVFVAPNGAQLGELARLFDDGALRAPALERLPLAEAAEAHRRIATRHVRGKLVLVVRP